MFYEQVEEKIDPFDFFNDIKFPEIIIEKEKSKESEKRLLTSEYECNKINEAPIEENKPDPRIRSYSTRLFQNQLSPEAEFQPPTMK